MKKLCFGILNFLNPDIDKFINIIFSEIKDKRFKYTLEANKKGDVLKLFKRYNLTFQSPLTFSLELNFGEDLFHVNS